MNVSSAHLVIWIVSKVHNLQRRREEKKKKKKIQEQFYAAFLELFIRLQPH